MSKLGLQRYPGRWLNSLRQSFVLWGLALGAMLLIVLAHGQGAIAKPTDNFANRSLITDLSVAQRLPAPTPEQLPPAKSHVLPPTLTHWQNAADQGDYFSEVIPTPLGYLIWSQFPVRVYLDQTSANSNSSLTSTRQSDQWREAVLQAVQEWEQYLPLQVVQQPELADIRILRKAPPLQMQRTPDGKLTSRVRSAETRYEFYTRQQPDAPATLAHRCTIWLHPSQAVMYTQATARHELGHALGIWGHSPLATDALYFSQVRHPPEISARDINTLKRIYQQPTRLGWSLPQTSQP